VLCSSPRGISEKQLSLTRSGFVEDLLDIAVLVASEVLNLYFIDSPGSARELTSLSLLEQNVVDSLKRSALGKAAVSEGLLSYLSSIMTGSAEFILIHLQYKNLSGNAAVEHPIMPYIPFTI